MTVFNGHFLFLSCDLFFNGHFLFLPSPPVSMVKPLYAVFMFMKVCCIVFMSLEMSNILTPLPRHTFLCHNGKCSLIVQDCCNTQICLPLSANGSQSFSPQWQMMDSISKSFLFLCLLKQYMFGTRTWLNESIKSGLRLFVFSSLKGKEPTVKPREHELKCLRGYWSLTLLHLSMRDGQQSQSIRVWGKTPSK